MVITKMLVKNFEELFITFKLGLVMVLLISLNPKVSFINFPLK